MEQGLCPDHGTPVVPSGACPACPACVDDRGPRYAVQLVPSELDDRARGVCGSCDARIFVTGPAVADGLCRPCRQEQQDPAAAPEPEAGRAMCTGVAGVPCDRPPLPTRPVCRMHRAHQLTHAGSR